MRDHEFQQDLGPAGTADLAGPAAPQAIFEQTRDEAVEILINNAGFGLRGAYAETDWATESRMIQVNDTALAHLIKLFLPEMLRRGSGRILNVASTAAFFPGPMHSVYYASKAFVLSFSQALAEELEPSGISVTCLCPGPTETEFARVAGMKSVRLPNLDLAEADDVAEFGYRAMKARERVAVHGGRNKLVVQAQRFVPRRLIARAMGRMQRRRL